MSVIVLPDPHPGRCLNVRSGGRCLDYDDHEGRCVFPEKDPEYDLYWQAQTRSWDFTQKQPEPWISPLVDVDLEEEQG